MEETNIIKSSRKNLIFILTGSVFLVLAYIINNISILKSTRFQENLFPIIFLSVLGCFLTYRMIPPFMEMFLKKKIQGIDINKLVDYQDLSDPNRKIVPESLGLVPSVIFLALMIFYLFLFKAQKVESQQLASILVSIAFMILLGFVDDILDLRWRYKLILPAIASIPIVIVYSEVATIAVPSFLKFVFDNKSIIELGILYNIYISMLAIFCTNAINIYAGINGLEVGQSIIITITMILYNFILIIKNPDKTENNIDSIIILVLFLSCILPLFYYNSYPSECFIGDTYCYFAGITLACAAIIGKFAITALLFFIPQIINFLLSIPQLVGIIPCPRHRLPKFDGKTKKLNAKVDQLNLLNQGLRLIGPTREQDICNIAMIFQIICSCFGLFLRLYVYPKIIN